MYTFLITGLIVFVVMSCIFKKNRTSGNARLIIASTTLVSMIIALSAVTYLRLDKLDTRVTSHAHRLELMTVSTDSTAYRIDTIVTDTSTVIKKNKLELTDKTANYYDVKKYSAIVFLYKTSLYVTWGTDDDTDWLKIPANATIHISDENVVKKKIKEYVPDNWSAWAMPVISRWTEIYLSQTQYDLAKSNYPELTKLWKTSK